MITNIRVELLKEVHVNMPHWLTGYRDALGFTRFEKARIIGARALQIMLGAPVLIDVPKYMVDPLEIAEKEFAEGVIPITVRRLVNKNKKGS